MHTYYGDGHVLQGVTLDVERGTVTAVLAGTARKDDARRSIVGLTPARSGRVIFNAEDITRLPRIVSSTAASARPAGPGSFRR